MSPKTGLPEPQPAPGPGSKTRAEEEQHPPEVPKELPEGKRDHPKGLQARDQAQIAEQNGLAGRFLGAQWKGVAFGLAGGQSQKKREKQGVEGAELDYSEAGGERGRWGRGEEGQGEANIPN